MNDICFNGQCYDNYVITGGEPLLYPDRTLEVISFLRKYEPNTKIYLYTSIYLREDDRHFDIMKSVDGITYSIHGPATVKDSWMFEDLQESLLDIKKPARLWMDDKVDDVFEIDTRLWERITKTKPKEECPYSTNEDLYILY